MYALAGLIISYAFVWMYVLLFHVVPAENREMVNILSSQLCVGGTLSVIYYFFGSSKGSGDKNEMLHKSTPTEEKKE